MDFRVAAIDSPLGAGSARWLDRVERAVGSSPSIAPGQESAPPSIPAESASSGCFSTIADPRSFPFMQIKNGAFARLTRIGDSFELDMMKAERESSCLLPPLASTPFINDHIQRCLQAYSEQVHPWYPILDSEFSEWISWCLENASPPGNASFLVLVVLASGALVMDKDYTQTRPDKAYLSSALAMMHQVVLTPELRSVQCLVALGIHFNMLLKPLQAHHLAVMAIKRATDLQIGRTDHDEILAIESWVRVYRSALLIEAELMIPLKLSDTKSWEREDDILLPSTTDIWSASPEPSRDTSAVAYVLAEIGIRRMLQRNTTSVSHYPESGRVQYAPLIAKELEIQLEQWYTFLPAQLRFPKSRLDEMCSLQMSPQSTFLCLQYWACRASISWPSVVKVLDTQIISESTREGCEAFYHACSRFISAALVSVQTCLPNKWIIYASVFSISIGAFTGASSLLLHVPEIWTALQSARAVFESSECQTSPSLTFMRDALIRVIDGAGQMHEPGEDHQIL